MPTSAGHDRQSGRDADTLIRKRSWEPAREPPERTLSLDAGLRRTARRRRLHATNQFEPGSKFGGYLRICECVVTAVLGGLPSGSVLVVRVTRYGSGRFWACLSSDLSPGRRTGLDHSAGLIRSLSASWRDPSQMCRPGDSAQAGADVGPDPGRRHEPHDHAGRGSGRCHRDRHAPR